MIWIYDICEYIPWLHIKCNYVGASYLPAGSDHSNGNLAPLTQQPQQAIAQVMTSLVHQLVFMKLDGSHMHPQSLTWKLKMMVSKKKKLLFRFHVKLQGCSSKRPTVTLLPPILRALSEDVPHAPAYPEAMKRAFAYGFGASPNHGEGGSQGQSVTWWRGVIVFQHIRFNAHLSPIYIYI